MYLLLADIILVVHFAFILFVVGGQILILAGGFLKWQWVKHTVFRISHLLAIVVVVIQAWAGRWCFLTVWESRLRERAGESGYQDSFIRYWVGNLIFYEAPVLVFTWLYTIFALMVVGSWFWVKPTVFGSGKKRADRKR